MPTKINVILSINKLEFLLNLQCTNIKRNSSSIKTSIFGDDCLNLYKVHIFEILRMFHYHVERNVYLKNLISRMCSRILVTCAPTTNSPAKCGDFDRHLQRAVLTIVYLLTLWLRFLLNVLHILYIFADQDIAISYRVLNWPGAVTYYIQVTPTQYLTLRFILAINGC